MKVLRVGLVAAAFVACGPAAVVPLDVRDVRVAIPAPDPLWVDIVTPDQTVPPHSEKMFCTDLVYDGDETAFDQVKALQGKFGHHLVLVSTTKPNPPGTTYDCTDAASMANFRPFAIPLNDLPTGMGSYLPKGKPIVVQLHYINTTAQPLLIRDVVRLRKMKVDDVKVWTSVMTHLNTGFRLPPHSNFGTTFDCKIAADVNVLMIGGHMHEWGSALKIELGPDTAHLKTEYEVKEWKADYRDDPPVNLYTQNPKLLPAGTVIRTSCSWNNTTDHTIGFPEEMCVSFGLVSGTKEPVVCILDQL